MILRAIRAENFVKFESLELDGLPETGVIGIEGPNESGKSTIAESVLFAFFGCPRERKPAPLDQLIRWGSHRARVEIHFSLRGAGGDEEFLIVREIDRLGTNWVRVREASTGHEIARGNLEVRDFVRERLRMDAAEFQRSVFHCQSECEAHPETLREFLDKMTGARPLAVARESLRREVERLEREFGQYQKEAERARAQAHRFAGGVTRLPELEAQAAAGERAAAERQCSANARRREIDEKREHLRALEACERKMLDASRADASSMPHKTDQAIAAYRELETGDDGLRGFLAEHHPSFPETIEGLAACRSFFADLKELGDAFSRETADVQRGLDPKEEGSTAFEHLIAEERALAVADRERRFKTYSHGSFAGVIIAIVAAIVFLRGDGENLQRVAALECAAAVVAVASFVAAVRLAGKRNAARRESHELAELRDRLRASLDQDRQRAQVLAELTNLFGRMPVADWLERARSAASEKLASRIADFTRNHGRFLRRHKNKESGPGRVLQGLARKEKQARDAIEARLDDEARQLREIENESKRARGEQERVQNEIRDARSQVARVEALDAQCQDLEARAAEVQSRIDDHIAATHLIDAAVASIRLKLGPALENLIRGALPSLTGGRYRDVRVGDELELRVFSSDRGDFVAAEELSGGTNEALLLTLRLAFAQALVTAREVGPHVVILDEPFRMMDDQRVVLALRALRELSGDLTQFLVIQPSFSTEQRACLDCRVMTTPGAKRLQASFVERAPARETSGS